MTERRVVVTGLGLLSPLGNSVQENWQNALLGKSGISSIGAKIKGSKDHSFDNPEKDVTVFHARDRGEKRNATSKFKNRDSIKFDSGEEYGYIYNMKDKKWYYKAKYGNPQAWTALK